MRKASTEKKAIILASIRSEMSSGKSMKEAVREIMKSRMFNHMTVRGCGDKLTKGPSLRDYARMPRSLNGDEWHPLAGVWG